MDDDALLSSPPSFFFLFSTPNASITTSHNTLVTFLTSLTSGSTQNVRDPSSVKIRRPSAAIPSRNSPSEKPKIASNVNASEKSHSLFLTVASSPSSSSSSSSSSLLLPQHPQLPLLNAPPAALIHTSSAHAHTRAQTQIVPEKWRSVVPLSHAPPEPMSPSRGERLSPTDVGMLRKDACWPEDPFWGRELTNTCKKRGEPFALSLSLFTFDIVVFVGENGGGGRVCALERIHVRFLLVVVGIPF